MTVTDVTDVLPTCVVGAGLAGLTVARHLRAAGEPVRLLEKSRGLGGRLARRRLETGFAEHGLPLLRQSGPRTQALMTEGQAQGLLAHWGGVSRRWTGTGAEPIPGEDWVAPQGLSGLARHLGEGLPVELQQRVVALEVTAAGWRLQVEGPAGLSSLQARRLVLAIPAAQALALLQTLPQPPADLTAALATVRYERALTAIATYPQLPQPSLGEAWRLDCPGHPQLRWIGLDSSKGDRSALPVVVAHSQGDWAERRFEDADLSVAGRALLAAGADLLDLPQLAHPEQLQVHRWGYALPSRGVEAVCLAQEELQLWLGGDWCGDQGSESLADLPHSVFVERALASGEAIAARLLQKG